MNYDICPLCSSELIPVNNGQIISYQCRKDYIYLSKDYPICHFVYSHHEQMDESKYMSQLRFVIFPFAIITYIKQNKSKILSLTDGATNISTRVLFWLPSIYVDKDNKSSVYNRLLTLLLYK